MAKTTTVTTIPPKARAAALRLQFTDAERELVAATARSVWDEVGYDALFEGMSEREWRQQYPRRKYPTMSRRQVMEIACDAGRIEERLIQDGQKELADRVSAIHVGIYDLVRSAFPEKTYGA